MLGGMICCNKIKKKGQQDTYTWYMETHVGYHVPYPDMSNTCYGTHGDAAATIMVYCKHFVNFTEFVRKTKDQPGLMNIEQNFADALNDIPTITELCVLALYNIAVSQPFMGHVRKHDNILQLESFFQKKADFLQAIAISPSLWTGKNVLHATGSLSGGEWTEWDMEVLKAVKKHSSMLSDLDDAIVAFVDGAHKAFVECFSNEFKIGSGINTLTENKCEKLYFLSTNDANEGGLGSWQCGQVRQPAETLQKFNASFVAARNNTESFITYKLTEEEEDLYVM
ncbi:unnamed protein product [Cyclocybe aegerita]|uniref:Uncharacterized protein n=1 Tax=Cyclocybe aegerita TaxID=1973307 RepID=A0A8S0WRU4_CYCAE|nr:unnamed protein product [Cyclocybe aegerita]